MPIDQAEPLDPAGAVNDPTVNHPTVNHPTSTATRRGPDPSAPFGCPVVHGRPSEEGADQGGARKARTKRGYFIPGMIALVVLAVGGGVANFSGLDHAAPNRLAGPDVETSLAQAIQAQDHLASPPSIRCPANEPVRVGLHFTCTWQRTGGKRAVSVTEIDARGQFRYKLGPGQP